MPLAPLPFVDVSGAPGGGYVFRTPDGRDMRFAGESADMMARAVARERDARNAGMLAQNETGAAPAAANPGAAPRPPVDRHGTPTATPMDPSQLPYAAAPVADTDPTREPVPAAPPVAQFTGGVSRQALERKASGAVPIPTTRSVQTEGGVAPEFAESLAKSYAGQATALRDEYDTKRTVLEAEREGALADMQQARETQARAAQEAAQREQQVARMREDYGRRIAAAAQVVDDQGKKEPETFRVFSGKPESMFALMLGQFLGHVGQQLSHSQVNYAHEMMNRLLDEDIKTQRDQINRGVATAQNRLAALKEQSGGDLETAEKLYKLAANARQSALIDARAAQSKIGQTSVGLAELQSKLAQQRVALEKDLATTIAGKVQTSNSFRLESPTGPRRLSPEEIYERQTKGEELRARRAKARGEVAKYESGEGEGGSADAQVMTQERATGAAQASLEDTAGKMGLTKKGGKWVLPEGGSIPGVGLAQRVRAKFKPDFVQTSEDDKIAGIRAAAENLAVTFANRSGREASPAIVERLLDQISAAKTPEQAVSIMNTLQSQLDAESLSAKQQIGAKGVRKGATERGKVVRELGREQASTPTVEER